MKIDSSIKSILSMRDIFFEKIIFENPNKVDMTDNMDTQLRTEFKEVDKFSYNVKIVLKITNIKDSDFNITIGLSSMFDISEHQNISDKTLKILIKKRTLSILFPYLRSQLTILTSQPNFNPIVLPIIDINSLIDNE